MENNKQYIEFINTFQEERDFFKCHEILENIWIKETACNTKKHVSINLLLISVGVLHWRNKNFKGALSVLRNSLNDYEEMRGEIEKIGIDSYKLKNLVEELLIKISLNETYKEVYLPVF
ncbi:DUF309 domain-containing protein [uncultured Cetobacterium sp.]|uniref:DUF309 domain-containing protein n=1 Tax=uncultured Cetobacterium sp. TaxID=527638 RepID=UPI002607D872|nr:DUF309 domain-containing protein [uncultured Cetobacterium sp.]